MSTAKKKTPEFYVNRIIQLKRIIFEEEQRILVWKAKLALANARFEYIKSNGYDVEDSYRAEGRNIDIIDQPATQQELDRQGLEILNRVFIGKK